MGDELALTGSVSIALGGMIGGGIYAVLGVVAGITGPATWAAFVAAGAVALCAGYSYNALNRLDDNRGGSVTFVQSYVGNSTLAGMVGWTLLVGYIGSMAMYAFAFGEFSVALGLPESVSVGLAGLASLPTRPLVSLLAVSAFVGLNLLGARATGSVENLLVAAKVAILVAFGVVGLWYGLTVSDRGVSLGLTQLASAGPVVAAAISFVAFQGWQLLFYDQDSITDPVETIRKAVYISIPAAVVVYVLVAVVTVALAPQALEQHPHVALSEAAARMVSPFGLAAVGATALSLSALFSTGSAINATLFSAAHFAEGLVTQDLVPDRIATGEDDGVSSRAVLVLGGLTAAFAAFGSLGAITSFASLAFIVVFGAMSGLALAQRDRDSVSALPPALGLAGTAAFFPLMLYRLATEEPGTFRMVMVIAAAVLAAELLYFERETLEREIEEITPAADPAD